jgi:DNA-binding CsgD family transcriptional regulator
MPARKPPAKPEAAPPGKSAPVARKPGRPPYETTDKDRTMVRLMCAGGITQDRIAAAIEISTPTLRKHYKRDIMVGGTEIDAQAIGALVTAMRSGGKQAVAAAKFWCQSRMGWSERMTDDDGKPADIPMRVIVELVGDAAASRVEQSASRTGFSDTIRKNVQLVG